ncbi:carboxyltransferase domain-containing protein [Corynebacterium timonense]|uniref:Sensor histidine kinase inhibitor, KipI family n=1 Tax=Corynebacterium timonense TaxID=441500 RepID=A0A1H1QXD5_9CORY|nr:carboxyltransferase domain-containing protein [Corynebacterium timonense]SDS28043.1 sensor histidine kinase inhibitor, KipI family [Corynebacterium timonense]
MSAPVVKRVGSRALIVDLPDLATVMDWHAALSARPLHRQTDVVAAARTVLITFDSAGAAAAAASALAAFRPDAARRATPRDIEIEVLYDGADLGELADSLSMSRAELIDWHTSTTWVAAFGGFAPGFTYCVPAEPERALDVPRRSSPRTQVPAGAVAVAGDFSAVYPRTSPGGWQLVGTTRTPMWDSAATPPALVAPGDRVRYVAVDSLPEETAAGQQRAQLPPRRPVLAVDDPGLQTLYQDLGRPGHGDLGVTSSGSADRASARAANAAVGNQRGATLLENIGGLTLRALTETVVAVTGAEAHVTVDGRPALLAHPTLVPAGAQLVVAAPSTGMRTYVAVRGGLVADAELGSSATDMLSGLGPAPVAAGDTLSVSLQAPQSTNPRVVNPLRVAREGADTVGVVRCVLGPRDDWFTQEAVERFLSTTFTVTPESNRVGLRLESDDPLERGREGELASEGMVAGSVQVPPSGQPVLFLRDHAVTGGYPVIATVISDDVDVAAQLPPGGKIRFELYSV